jgi:hypothetical protein
MARGKKGMSKITQRATILNTRATNVLDATVALLTMPDRTNNNDAMYEENDSSNIGSSDNDDEADTADNEELEKQEQQLKERLKVIRERKHNKRRSDNSESNSITNKVLTTNPDVQERERDLNQHQR